MNEITLVDIVANIGQLCEYRNRKGDWIPVYITAFVGAGKQEDEYVELTSLRGAGCTKVYASDWSYLLRKATMSREQYLEKFTNRDQ